MANAAAVLGTFDEEASEPLKAVAQSNGESHEEKDGGGHEAQEKKDAKKSTRSRRGQTQKQDDKEFDVQPSSWDELRDGPLKRRL